MKTIRRFWYPVLSGLVTGWLSAGCTPNANEAAPQDACRIQQYMATSKSGSSNTTNQTTYTYDSLGNLIKSVATLDSRPITGTFGSQTGITTSAYTYDAAGYLTGSTSQRQTTTIGLANKSTTEVLSVATSYSYTSGRLTQKSETHTGTYSSSVAPSISTYDYDANGNLTTITNGTTGTNSFQSILVYRNNQLVDYIEKSGGSEKRPYTIENGLVKKMVFPGAIDELTTTTEFDGQKRIIRQDEYINSQLNRYTLQTWTDAKPASASLPAFKGFPGVSPASPLSGPAGVLASVKYFYWNSISKTMQQLSESTSIVQTNAKGFVTNNVTTVKYSNPDSAPQDYITTEVYTYAGCQ